MNGIRIAPVSFLLVSGYLALVLSGCARQPAGDADREVAQNVRVMPLETAAVTEYLEVAGPVRPVRGTDISSEESGTVAAIERDKGARVGDGTVLVTLDRRLLAAELAAAEANLQLQAYNLEKTRQLFDAGKISRVELLEAEAQHAQAESARDIAETRHDRARIKAPFAGLVTERFVEPGQLVAPGQPVARVIDPFVLKLAGALTETEVAWVRAGMAADVQLEGVAAPARGEVAWVGFEADHLNGKFPVEIHIANPDLAFRAGVIARARLVKRTTSDVVVIPRDAVLPGRGRDTVFVVEGDRARERLVELGPDQGLLVAVRSGLVVGELLVVRGQRELTDGSLVVVTERVAYGDGTAGGDPAVIKSASADTRVTGEVIR